MKRTYCGHGLEEFEMSEEANNEQDNPKTSTPLHTPCFEEDEIIKAAADVDDWSQFDSQGWTNGQVIPEDPISQIIKRANEHFIEKAKVEDPYAIMAEAKDLQPEKKRKAPDTADGGKIKRLFSLRAHSDEDEDEPREDDGGTMERDYRFIRSVNSNVSTKCIISYVFIATRIKAVRKNLRELRDGKFRNTVWYSLSEHFNAPCAGLFEEPTDHYHLLVWFDDTTRPTDGAFHRRFYNWTHGAEWNSQKVKSERAICQYVQCEPRKLIELYSSAVHKTFMDNCYAERELMKEKIDARDEKKKKNVNTKVNYIEENDWWVERGMSVQAIITCIIDEGIRDVERFLNWLAKYHSDKSIASLTFNPNFKRLEQQINMSIRRHWLVRTVQEQREGRRKQICDAVKAGKMFTKEFSVHAIEDILRRNGHNVKQFVTDFLDVVYKKKNKINTMYLHGSSNSCKSTIAWSFLNGSPNVSQGMASAEFMYQNCVNASYIWFEELKITPDIINEIKRILEGSETCVNKKNNDGVYLQRTPVIACSNYEPWNFACTEKETLLNRMNYYKFTVFEEHKKYDKALNPFAWEELEARYYVTKRKKVYDVLF